MSSNVGLSTPRGSGTSGYVQRNLSFIKPRDSAPPPKDIDTLKYRQRQPDKGILEHDRRREIEVKVFELRDRLEEDGEIDEDEIDERCSKLRAKLENESRPGGGGAASTTAKGLKSHQVHELARAKIEESEKLRRALGIRKDYEEGSHWKAKDERLRLGVEQESKSKPVREESRRSPPRRERGGSRSRSRSRSPRRHRDRSRSPERAGGRRGTRGRDYD